MAEEEHLGSAEQPEEEHIGTDKYFYIITGIILLLLIVFFSIGYYWNTHKENNPSKDMTYNGFSFSYFQDADIWRTQWQNEGQLYNVYFHYSPLEAEKVPIYQKQELSSAFNASEFYVTFDPLANSMKKSKKRSQRLTYTT